MKLSRVARRALRGGHQKRFKLNDGHPVPRAAFRFQTRISNKLHLLR